MADSHDHARVPPLPPCPDPRRPRAARAHGERRQVITIGSDLKADASITQSHGADTAFWPTSVKSTSPAFPEDGQILSVTIKGTVLKDKTKGAADPANLIHFQSLVPEGDNGAMRVYLTSGNFYLPIEKPNTITTFEPENLCVKKGGVAAFNDIGGFGWTGSLDSPADYHYYPDGAPFQIFGAVKDSTTAWYSKDNGTKNNDVLTPSGGENAVDGHGDVMRGTELLMQLSSPPATIARSPAAAPAATRTARWSTPARPPPT